MRKLLVRFGLVVAGTAVALLLAELVARIAVPADVAEFFTPFPTTIDGYSAVGADGERWFVPGAQGVSGEAPVRINALGLRDDREYAAKKPTGCFRVLALGDSMTFGQGVRETDTWPGVLETRLAARHPGRCIEVLNAGMPGLSFEGEVHRFESRWRALDPDLVLVGFFAWNDTRLREDEPQKPAWLRAVDRHPALLHSALVRWAVARGTQRLGARDAQAGVEAYYAEAHPGYRAFTVALERLSAMAQEAHFRAAVALLPFPAGYDAYPLKELDVRLEAIFSAKGFAVADLVLGLTGIDAAAHRVHPSDPHPDAFVHEAMAEQALRALPWEEWLSAP